MLEGYEDITIDIKPHEIEMAKNVAASIIKQGVGKKNAISNKRIQVAILNKYGEKYDGIRVRRMISHIRSWNLVPRLCSNSKGYFMAANDEEWESWKTSMRQRIRALEYTYKCATHFNDGGETL